MKTFEYTEILGKLICCREWLPQIGIEFRSELLEKLIKFVEALIPNIGNKMKKDEIEGYYQMIYDCYCFIDIYETFKDYPVDNDIRGKIKSICRMNPIYKKSNDSGRNYLLEFELGSFFKNGNMKLLGFDDLKFQLDNYTINIECKRIASEKKVSKNIKKAYEQIKPKLTEQKSSKGFIAISIEQIICPDGTFNSNNNLVKNIAQFSSEQQMNDVVIQLSSAFIKEFRYAWANIIDPRVIGIIQVFKFISKMNGNDNLAFIPIIMPLATRNEFENRFIIEELQRRTRQ